MSASFEFEAPDHFTAGAVGPPGQRVFYLQAREKGTLVTLKSEKEQVRALAEYLSSLLEKLPAVGERAPRDLSLLEPVDAGLDRRLDRASATTRRATASSSSPTSSWKKRKAAIRRPRACAITRAQAAAFVEQADVLMKGSRPICPWCSQPKDPGGHVCPRSNGHVVH